MGRRSSILAVIAAALLAAGAGGCAVETAGGERAALQEGSTPFLNCGAERCDRDEACCRATGHCYHATCVGCCPTDLPLAPPAISAGIDAGMMPFDPRPPLPCPGMPPWTPEPPQPPR